MFTFFHKVQYYETDQMRVVHHSNYVKWLEEIRGDWMEAAGIPYHVTEEKGILCPVLSVKCNFKYPARYGETIRIQCKCTFYNSIRFKVEYLMYNPDDMLVFEGESEHFFTNLDFRPISLARTDKEMNEIFASIVE